MKYQIIFTPRAKASLLAIEDYIAFDNPIAATRLVDALEKQCNALEQFPRRHPKVREDEKADIRHFIHGNYRVTYEIYPKAVWILDIRHTSRMQTDGSA